MTRDDFDLTEADIDVLSNLFQRDLEPDRWLPAGQRYRSRAYQCFDLSLPELRCTPIAAPPPYLQSADVNPLAGGIERRFAAIPVEHPATSITVRVASRLARLLIDADILDPSAHPRCWVDAHYIRIDAPGDPCPEGPHRDGLLAGSAHLVRRNNITGGESILYDTTGREAGRCVLAEPMDSFVFHDSEVLHFTEPIAAEDAGVPGFRDALLIGFRTA
ncbi:2OG-Fe dioxygenase family protein [Nocardia sp. NPDC051833]|uniref:2OG-Fe dioxygenase family protein n=1 Tax=Nocardia sp. NPDC051833 TaxID=3155674 RepID=UPI00343FC281